MPVVPERAFGRHRLAALLITWSLPAVAALPGQEIATLIERLRDPVQRPRATVELKGHGSAAATALLDAFAGGMGPDAPIYAEVLAECGGASGAELPRLTTLFPRTDEPSRTLLLRAIGNGVLTCTDDAAIERLRAELAPWAKAGLFYSLGEKQPTFAWFEYVRLQRRLALRRGDVTADGLRNVLAEILRGREQLGAFGVLGGERAEAHNLSAFGQHATRESLEAIAELALPMGTAGREVVDELALYLQHEPPRPGQVLQEDRAGIGETAPAAMDARFFPTLWRRDDWRFAIARAVFAVSTDRPSRVHALRHLLHGPTAADRLDALAALRQWPQPWREFGPELTACLGSPDRIVVRDALVTLGLAEGVELPAADLERIADGTDKELAALAKRLRKR